MIEHTLDNRGFKWCAPVEGAYGGQATVHESSAASGPHLWLSVEEPNDLNAWTIGDKTGGTHEAALHLTAEAAAQLRDTLDWALEHHYQGDAR